MAIVATRNEPSEKTPQGRLPEIGEDIESPNHNRFTLREKIGEGGYGSVFRVSSKNFSKPLALKAEAYAKSMLKNEITVLRSANSRNCKHICTLFDYGRVDRDFVFIVITLLGPDLYKLKREQPGQRFSIGTAVRVAMQTLNAVEELHMCGFISRDIKPSNFAIGTRSERLTKLIFLFDFGLARRYVDQKKRVLPPRGSVGWRGTCRYGSLHAHCKEDLGRRDDVESWLYMIAELTVGTLPWRFTNDRDEVRKAKEEIRSSRMSANSFLSKCPQVYERILEAIDHLKFEETPPYNEFYEILKEVQDESQSRLTDPYDWESEEVTASSPALSVSTTPDEESTSYSELRSTSTSRSKRRPSVATHHRSVAKQRRSVASSRRSAAAHRRSTAKHRRTAATQRRKAASQRRKAASQRGTTASQRRTVASQRRSAAPVLRIASVQVAKPTRKPPQRVSMDEAPTMPDVSQTDRDQKEEQSAFSRGFYAPRPTKCPRTTNRFVYANDPTQMSTKFANDQAQMNTMFTNDRTQMTGKFAKDWRMNTMFSNDWTQMSGKLANDVTQLSSKFTNDEKEMGTMFTNDLTQMTGKFANDPTMGTKFTACTSSQPSLKAATSATQLSHSAFLPTCVSPPS